MINLVYNKRRKEKINRFKEKNPMIISIVTDSMIIIIIIFFLLQPNFNGVDLMMMSNGRTHCISVSLLGLVEFKYHSGFLKNRDHDYS